MKLRKKQIKVPKNFSEGGELAEASELSEASE